MSKAIALLLVVAVACVAAQGHTRDESAKKRMAAVGPKDLDIKRLEGKWFEVGSSKAIHQMFLKGCKCNQINFQSLAEDKLHVMAACLNSTNNQLSAINGTLTQTRPQENKSLFNLVFTEKKGDIPKVEVNKTEAREVKKIEKGEGGAGTEGEAKGKAGSEGKAKGLEANVVILKLSDNFDHVIMGSPALDSAWILSRKPQIDEKQFNEYKKFLEQNGFTSTKLAKIDHSQCPADVIKGKSGVSGGEHKGEQKKLMSEDKKVIHS